MIVSDTECLCASPPVHTRLWWVVEVVIASFLRLFRPDLLDRECHHICLPRPVVVVAMEANRMRYGGNLLFVYEFLLSCCYIYLQPFYRPTSPAFSPTSPKYSPTSPQYRCVLDMMMFLVLLYCIFALIHFYRFILSVYFVHNAVPRRLSSGFVLSIFQLWEYLLWAFFILYIYVHILTCSPTSPQYSPTSPQYRCDIGYVIGTRFVCLFLCYFGTLHSFFYY